MVYRILNYLWSGYNNIKPSTRKKLMSLVVLINKFYDKFCIKLKRGDVVIVKQCYDRKDKYLVGRYMIYVEKVKNGYYTHHECVDSETKKTWYFNRQDLKKI